MTRFLKYDYLSVWVVTPWSWTDSLTRDLSIAKFAISASKCLLNQKNTFPPRFLSYGGFKRNEVFPVDSRSQKQPTWSSALESSNLPRKSTKVDYSQTRSQRKEKTLKLKVEDERGKAKRQDAPVCRET